jgi:ribosome-binding protein aMBF1 (putative translation factor)
MASKRKKTAFDKYFDEQMAGPAFREGYERARREIDTVDQLVRALDEARVGAGMTKAELARKISAKPEVLRRFFTVDSPNPTFSTVVKLADALGFALQLVPKKGRAA